MIRSVSAGGVEITRSVFDQNVARGLKNQKFEEEGGKCPAFGNEKMAD
ncbi:MAG: hypothetical protein AAGJ52_06555 [Pseudomonadota bacterium]